MAKLVDNKRVGIKFRRKTSVGPSPLRFRTEHKVKNINERRSNIETNVTMECVNGQQKINRFTTNGC